MGNKARIGMTMKLFIVLALCLSLTACQTTFSQDSLHGGIFNPTAGPTPTLTAQESKIPVFDHIITIMFENQNYQEVIGNSKMPAFNRIAAENVLLTHYYAVAHPSLPNYIALIGGDTFGITSDCTTCFINQTSLPDLIEASGRTWKTYQEDLPSPCFVGNSGNYVQKHNPFIYFDAIRTHPERCNQSVVSLKTLDADLASKQLPNFAFIMPNMCNSAHDCSLDVADRWLEQMLNTLQSSPALGQNYLIYVAFEEGSTDNASCCGLPESAGGRVAAVLISPQAKSGFQEDTPFSHYGFLKTVLISWKLPPLGFAASPETQAITAPWK